MSCSSPQDDQKSTSRNNGLIVLSSSARQTPSNGHAPQSPEDQKPYKKVVKYKECLKNHAAAIGGSATDGCGEFMPSGEEGTIEALKCSACNCHRNFHKKIECDCPFECYHHSPVVPMVNNGGRALVLSHHHNHPAASTFISLGGEPTHHHQLIMPYKSGSAISESDEKDDGGGVVGRPLEHQKMRKRFRTKFSQEQKEKMLKFAERAEWRIQKLEESIVQQFCQEIGIKRRVLKVWMHNNKHSLAKKNSIN
ncbi:hypothetical protein Pint_27569 [Pistacia integerrima]|uniref:Uncharacterized protein n=1 Tax=Pistacia integerrima TaxID=434235 RepID=A0ACC0YUJ3_9ROSI|nr:hypothetical protein Pint_27569 [Pistacia integerrima]